MFFLLKLSIKIIGGGIFKVNLSAYEIDFNFCPVYIIINEEISPYMATMEQVARLANVSPATVSRVLNNPVTVSLDTRERVLKAIKSLDYEPNFLGRFLRTTQTNIVLVLVHSIDNPFFADIVNGIENIATVYDYNVIMANNHGSKEIGNRFISMMKNHLIDGIILLSNELDVGELDNLAAEYPLVQVIEYNKQSKADAICIDYYKASRELMDNFVALGRRNIAFINTNEMPIISTNEKYQAYLDCLGENGFPILTKPPLSLEEFGYDTSYEITVKLLKKHPQLDAIFTCSDMIAAGACAACQDHGKRVPEDIAISGFDDIFYAKINSPTITTVSHDTFNLGFTAMNHILKKINDEKPENNRIILPYEIIYRESAPKKE